MKHVSFIRICTHYASIPRCVFTAHASTYTLQYTAVYHYHEAASSSPPCEHKESNKLLYVYYLPGGQYGYVPTVYSNCCVVHRFVTGLRLSSSPLVTNNTHVLCVQKMKIKSRPFTIFIVSAACTIICMYSSRMSASMLGIFSVACVM